VNRDKTHHAKNSYINPKRMEKSAGFSGNCVANCEITPSPSILRTYSRTSSESVPASRVKVRTQVLLFQPGRFYRRNHVNETIALILFRFIDLNLRNAASYLFQESFHKKVLIPPWRYRIGSARTRRDTWNWRYIFAMTGRNGNAFAWRWYNATMKISLLGWKIYFVKLFILLLHVLLSTIN